MITIADDGLLLQFLLFFSRIHDRGRRPGMQPGMRHAALPDNYSQISQNEAFPLVKWIQRYM